MEQPKPILHIEDDENDVLFMRIAMERSGIQVPLQVARDGKQAMDYLQATGEFADREAHPLPCLVLLDLRLPRIPGLEILRRIRAQPELKDLIVICFTSSAADSDVETAYRLGVNAYVVKPTKPAELLQFVETIRDYWLRGIQPPPDLERSVRPSRVPALGAS